ncbi:hypothetical protein L596_019340 [Steinernema carpocapsae]|uniref:Uncharacterized protein n=1 Tax=Steinernema carpocapsae TaxID=34508 RepID=A0A4U5MQA5_STECR|nr:hypothetical protein L596_019340 [Steinernema carpocapsae]
MISVQIPLLRHPSKEHPTALLPTSSPLIPPPLFVSSASSTLSISASFDPLRQIAIGRRFLRPLDDRYSIVSSHFVAAVVRI